MKLNSELIDALDLRLLDFLQRKANATNHAMAQELGVSPATCLRRVQRLYALGIIEKTVALLNPERLALQLGHGLTALVEVTLDKQGEEHLHQFERRIVADEAITQCYRVSPGPDFVIVVVAHDMPAFLALSQRLFTQDANVRNVKTYFSIKQSKFEPRVPQQLGQPAHR